MKWVHCLCCILLVALGLYVYGCDDDTSSTGPSSGSDDYEYRTADVTYVYDGDTIQVDGDEKIRYIGIDTPEQGECYFWEATLRNRELVDDRTVDLEICRANPTDQYGRTLAHIKIDGDLVNAILLREGYADAVNIPPCASRANYYQSQEDQARNEGRGKWSDCE